VVLRCDASECFGKENKGKIGECSFCYMALHWVVLTYDSFRNLSIVDCDIPLSWRNVAISRSVSQEKG
jgi:hypothetical protein